MQSWQSGESKPVERMANIEEFNKQVVRRLIEETMNQGRLELVDELFSEMAVEHDPHQQAAATPREAFVAAVEMFRSAFPDNRMIIEDQIAEGDRVATRWRMSGTHQGEFMGIAASGRSVEVGGIFYDRLENGQMQETWAQYDLFGLIQQLQD